MRELYEKYKCRDFLKKLLKNQLDNTKKRNGLHFEVRFRVLKAATTYPPGPLSQVLWARESLTSVFGMGTGGSSLLSSPPWYIKSFQT